MNNTEFNIQVSSDWHADYTDANTQALIKENYSNVIDDKICLGDVLNLRGTEQTESEYDYWSDELLTLGNHDMIADTSGFDWTNQIAISAAYNRWFAPYVSTNGIDIVPDTLYWSKEYADKKILLIGGYCMYDDSNARQAQYTFFDEKLTYALENELSVIIAYHWGFEDMREIHCSFTNATALQYINGHDSVLPYLYQYEQTLSDLVSSYIARGLDFICWLNGHRHTDEITVKDGQLHILTGSTRHDPGNRVKRLSGTVTETLCNIVSYDKDNGIVTVRRYGADIRTFGGLRHLIMIDKGNNVVFDWGN